jgi:hypothetical protein
MQQVAVRQKLIVKGARKLNYPLATNYSDLPPASQQVGLVYAVLNSQGTAWLPGSLGGTYYSKGFYYSDGNSWIFMGSSPYQATQSQVNAGTADDVFVTPLTLANTVWTNPSYRYVTSNTTLLNTDGVLDCDGTLTVTLALLNSITHTKPIHIKNSGTGVITINTQGGELLDDVMTFDLYAGENLMFQKGTGKYIVE